MSSGLPVSLCMIARNEEHWIASCIQSVQHLVREIVVVDTGSTDRTKEVAAQSGARVFTFHWCDDFAAARNYSLSKATGDWILVLDADEILAPVKLEEFARLLDAPGVEGYFVKIRSYLGNGEGMAEDQVVRLFRNKPAYRFAGAIHEQVAGAIIKHNAGGGLAFSDLLIYHFGYLDRHLQVKNKHQRNICVIKKALDDKPDDPFLLYSLGIEHLQCGEIKKGIEQLEKALVFMRGNEGYFRDLLLTLCLGLFRTGQRDRLTFLLDGALSMLPADPDLHLLKGLLALHDGRCDTAIEELRFALTVGAQILPPYHIHALLGDSYNLLGQYGEAEDEYFNALLLAPHMLYPLTQILGLKQRGRGRLQWQALSRFASPSRKKALYKELCKLGELPLAMVLALLILVEPANSRNCRELIETCREYRLMVEQYLANRPGQEPLGNYLLTGASGMLLYASAVQRNLECGLFSFVQGLLRLASSALELVVMGLCPSWSPALLNSLTFGERIDLDAKGAHRQSSPAETVHTKRIPVVPLAPGDHGSRS
ncbi:glycosyltransferase family 2 protein [Desulfofundulus thermosubterraneus]|uniref:Tetratricopeptide repeat-containing protein n=1 Tax=Desulfofundulus thermosubterraneus DSM 16057 TaxID=1121432 RepID=A0A1M6D5E7_9FIRM|nr:glycosyltransferase family 2 protein [Desulfofundulus thermosubterraneus]SHI68324.1 Tetratricopeptide repeat-containing protein [Desulfofundulus thermosubterraneus DSM 16057]